MVCFKNIIVNTLHKDDNKDDDDDDDDNNNDDNNNNNNTCRGGDVEVESDGEINAAPNQILKTKYNTTKIS
jgi:hypothetical protein